MTQPEALRLAAEFENGEWIAHTSQWREEAAAELRRLHADTEYMVELVKKLVAQRDALLEACRMAMMLRQLGGMLPGCREVVEEIVEAARVAIKQTEGETE